MADPAFRAHVQAQTRETTAMLRRWLAEAIAGGELRPHADPAMLSRAVQAMLGGSLIAWGFAAEGSARAWVRRDLDILLGPWSTRRKPPRRRVARRPR